MRSLTPIDSHAIMNLLVKQATGQQSITVTDSSTFVSAGELVMATGVENTMNSLSIVLGTTYFANRPYKAKLALMDAIDTGAYTHRLRKISYYARNAIATGAMNTDLNPGNHLDNHDNNSHTNPNAVASMWEQRKPVAVEINFAGSDMWDYGTTTYKYDYKQAFRDEGTFNSFVSGIMTEVMNDLESEREAFNRMTLNNYIAGVYDMNATGSVVNLTAEFNSTFGTNYTSQQLRTTYLEDFLKFFVSEFTKVSKRMENRTAKYHTSPSKTLDGVTYTTILRHTPKELQRVYLYEPLFIDAKANVLPQIFNPEFLDMKTQYEGMMYWQAENTPSAIDWEPAIPDFTTGQQIKGARVTLDYVVGAIIDRDAMMTDMQIEDADTTPVEARKKYYNTWWTFAKNSINDFTENAVIFIMADPVTP